MNRVDCMLEPAAELKTLSCHWSGQLVLHVSEKTQVVQIKPLWWVVFLIVYVFLY